MIKEGKRGGRRGGKKGEREGWRKGGREEEKKSFELVTSPPAQFINQPHAD